MAGFKVSGSVEFLDELPSQRHRQGDEGNAFKTTSAERPRV